VTNDPRLEPQSDLSVLFRSVFNAAPDAMLLVDEKGCVVLVNTKVGVVFGYDDPTDLLGQMVEVLVPQQFRPTHPRRRTGYNHRPLDLLTLSGQRQDGSSFPAEISLAPVPSGSETWSCVTVRDITGRIEAEDEAHRAREAVLATITHELRTPLAVILGYTELVAAMDHVSLVEVHRIAKVIEASAHRELRMVNDLLTLSSFAESDQHLDLDIIDAVALVHGCVDKAAPRAAAAEVSLDMITDSTSLQAGPLLIPGDVLRLSQVFENLIENAIKFTPPGGRVEVSVGPADGFVVVQVQDTGVGVAIGEQRHLFERLFRTRSAIAGQTPGAGLGLAIVHAIVTAHHGTIAVTSVLGEGARFVVTLPQ
jgi:two-component system phosphate regulon sensor histidine kinase PhoR